MAQMHGESRNSLPGAATSGGSFAGGVSSVKLRNHAAVSRNSRTQRLFRTIVITQDSRIIDSFTECSGSSFDEQLSRKQYSYKAPTWSFQVNEMLQLGKCGGAQIAVAIDEHPLTRCVRCLSLLPFPCVS